MNEQQQHHQSVSIWIFNNFLFKTDLSRFSTANFPVHLKQLHLIKIEFVELEFRERVILTDIF